MTNTKDHFCTCTDTNCTMHPRNHDKGCDPCMQKNLKKGEMPSCMFHAVHQDISGTEDFTIAGFVDYYLLHKGREMDKG